MSEPTLDEVLGPPPFADPQEKAQYEALRRQVFAAEPPKDIFEAINLRDYAIEETKRRRTQRATTTLLRARRPAAAREILDPGAQHFAPGNPGYKPGEAAHDQFTEQMVRRDCQRGLPGPGAWSEAAATTTLEAAAVAELAKHGVGPEGLNDVAYRLDIDLVERLEALGGKQFESREQALELVYRQRQRAALAHPIELQASAVDE